MTGPQNIRIHPAFAIPIVQIMLPSMESLNGRLRELLLTWEADTARERLSQPTAVPKHAVYESDFHLFSRENPDIKFLATQCLQYLGLLIAQLNRYSNEEMGNLRIYHHSWYHITRNGGYTAVHNHPMASWSGVYCVDPGEPATPDIPNNGALRFLDMRTTANNYIDMGNAYLSEPYCIADLAYPLAPGMLLLFPSYLIHEVAPYFGQRERITIAFNTWVKDHRETPVEPSVVKRDR